MKRFLQTTVVFLVLTQASALWPCGMNTHSEVSVRARWFFDGGAHPDIKGWLQRYESALQAGSPFPDWGYASGHQNESDVAHGNNFMKTAAQYIYETYPQPWDNEETQKLAVFMLGIVSHNMADTNYHRKAGIAEGFIEAMAYQDFGGAYSPAHTIADTGGEMMISYQQDMSWHSWSYYFPVDDMAEVYARYYGDDHVTVEMLTDGTQMLALGGVAGRLAGWIVAPFIMGQSQFLTEQFQDYFLGGLDDMGVWTQWQWETYVDYMENGVPTSAVADLPEADLADDVQKELIELGKWLWQTGLLDVQTTRTPRGVIHEIRYYGELPDAPKANKADFIPGDINDSVRLYSETAYADAGQSLADGDFNGDGFADLAIGAPGHGGNGDPQSGRVYVVFGGRDVNGHEELALSTQSVDVILAGSEVYGRFGYSLAVVDLNADGRDDLAVSAPAVGGDAWQYRGKVYVFFADESGISTEPDLVISAQDNITNLGWRLASGDLDGDGARDLVIGSPFAKSGGRQRGKVDVFLSTSAYPAGSELTEDDADSVLYGQSNFEWFGYALQVAESAGGENFLVVGAPAYRMNDAPNAGRLYGYRFADLTGDDPRPYFTLTGDTAFAKFGAHLLYDDVDGDGIAELVVSAPTQSGEGGKFAGALWAYEIDSLAGNVFVQSLSPKMHLQGDAAYARFAWRAAAHDFNKDGLNDFVVTQPYLNTDAGREAGAAHLLMSGGQNGQAALTSKWDIPYDHDKSLFGAAVAFPDINGDGFADLAVGAPRDHRYARIGGAVTVLVTPTPKITEAWPPTLVRGGSSILQIRGKGLREGDAQIQVTQDGFTLGGGIVEQASDGRSVKLRLDIPADAPLGYYDVRVAGTFSNAVKTAAFECLDGNWDEPHVGDDDDHDDDQDSIESDGPAAKGDDDDDDNDSCGKL